MARVGFESVFVVMGGARLERATSCSKSGMYG